MKYFVDIRVLPDPEFTVNQILSTLFRKLHQVLVQLNSQKIGVSFPLHGETTLGTTMRLHGAEVDLNNLMGLRWLTGMIDYVELSPISKVPEGVKYRTVYRVQAKSSPARLRRRAMRRHNISSDEAIRRIPDNVAETLKLPFIQLASASTKQNFPLFVCHGPISENSSEGCYSSYGFSSITTVPWF